MQLNDIAKGKKRRDVFMEEIRSYTVELIDEIKTEEGTFRHDNLTNKKCPNCGKRLLAVNGKNAKLLVCQDREVRLPRDGFPHDECEMPGLP